MPETRNPLSTTVIRRATRDDAAQACQVLVRSIREICAKDYGYDEAILTPWCANKTVENVTAWIASPDHYFPVAEVSPLGIVGVGLLSVATGQIALCYLVPEVLHQGVGKRLLTAMEAHAKTAGHPQVTLISSITARPFYLRNGYQANGAPTTASQIAGFPMIKSFTAP